MHIIPAAQKIKTENEADIITYIALFEQFSE